MTAPLAFVIVRYDELASVRDTRRGWWLLGGALVPLQTALRWAARVAEMDDADRVRRLRRAEAEATRLLAAHVPVRVRPVAKTLEFGPANPSRR